MDTQIKNQLIGSKYLGLKIIRVFDIRKEGGILYATVELENGRIHAIPLV